MTNAPVKQMTLWVAGLGAGLSALAFALWGTEHGLAALAGVGVALVNLHLLAWIVGRVTRRAVSGAGRFVGLLLLKMGGVMAFVYWLLSRGHAEPLGFLLGLSALVGGLLASSSLSAADTARSES